MEWTRGHPIGRGSTATVSVATTTTTNETFAVKSVELNKSELLQREEKIVSTLDHPNIVKYKGYDITKEDNKFMFNLKMEYLPEGNLSDTIKKSGGGQLKEPMISCYTRQIIQGLNYLHSIGIVHCDIKGQNILTGQSGCKIADFGCAKLITPANPSVHMAGTPLFMAPEVARGEEQGCPADIWALGCTILEMFTGCSSPWPNAKNIESLLYRLAFFNDLPEIPQNLSDQAKDFLSKCLTRNPKERWTAKQLLNHQFLEQQFNGALKLGNQELGMITASPTSILDQDIWDSEESSDQSNLSCMILDKSNNSPSQRLGLFFIQSGHPNWTWENNWITIRAEEKD